MTIDERTETPVLLTDDAATKVSELLQQEEDQQDLALRLMAVPGGCSGFQYDMRFDTQVEASDTVSEMGGVKLVIDEESVPRLIGATIDYREDAQGSGFAIENPNETGHSCTCGKR